MKKTTIVIVDDHTLIREMWGFVLESNPEFSVTGQSGTAEEGIELAKGLQPDLVLMDINLPNMDGIEALKEVKKVSPGSKILGVSLHTQPAYAKKMMKEGASGYVTKSSSREEMFKAITQILQGKKYICDEIKNILSEQMLNGDGDDAGINSLSRRELDIMAFVKQGQSSKEIAETLNISVKTVEVHRYNILKKLNLKNSAALVNFIHSSKLEFTSG